MTEEQTNEYESEMTLDIFLNWLDRPDTAGLELYPREVKEVRGMLSNVRDELELYKRALGMACKDTKRHHLILNCLGFEHWEDYYLQKAREQGNDS